MKTIKTILIAVFFLTVSNGLMAQDPADISANATVLTSAELTGESDLEFGDVTIDTPKEVLPADSEAGYFTLRTNTAAVITFTFPANLTTTVDGQERLLPISFDGDYVTVDGKDNAGADISETYNPVSNASYDLTLGNFDHANVFDIYLGGEVTPAANQAAGSYTGTVTLSVTIN